MKVYWIVDNRLQSINPIIPALTAISKEGWFGSKSTPWTLPWSVEYWKNECDLNL